MKKRHVIILTVGIGILAGSFILNDYLTSLKEPPEVKPIEVTKKFVRTKPVQYGIIPTEVKAYGRGKTAEMLDLIAEVPGRMTAGSVSMKEGERFRKGDLIYKIDDIETRLNLQSQKSNFLRDLAAILPDMKIDFSENYPAWSQYFESINLERPLPSLPTFKSSKEKTFLATKNIFSTYYSIKSAEANLKKYRFYAPFNGIISNVDLQSGSFVNPGNKIGTVLRSDRLELKVDVGVADNDWVEKGSEAEDVTEAGSSWSGTVERVGEFVNQNTQSIDVYIALNQKRDQKLYDGEYLESTIPGKIIENGMVMPRNAIFEGNKVFILQDSVLKVKEINILKVNPETAVFHGLAENTELVVEPLINAHNNMRAYKLEEKGDIDIENKESKAQLVKN